MPIISVVRHGQDEDNRNGILNGHRDQPLTEVGIGQACELRFDLKHRGIAVIYSSPLQRAKQTAEIIAAEYGLVVNILDDLIEREFGVMTGQPVADITKVIPAADLLITPKINYFLHADGAEEFESVYARAKKVVDFVRQVHPDNRVLLVCHGDIAKMIRAYYHGQTYHEGLLSPYIANCDIVELF